MTHGPAAKTSKVIVLLASLAMSTGCDPGKLSMKAPETPSAKTTAPTSKPKVTLEAATWPRVAELVKEHSGKIVVVDIWSTACEPCLREFPNLLELQSKHPDDVVCISFDCDYDGLKSKPVSYYEPRVKAFLEEQKASIINLMSTQAADELFADLELDSIPAVYIYDREGRLSRRFDGSTNISDKPDEEAFTYARHVVPHVESLLKISPSAKKDSVNP